MDATDQDWDKLIVAMDACNYESVGYMGPLDDIVPCTICAPDGHL